MSVIKVDYGEVGGGGIKAAKGVITPSDWNGTSSTSTVSITGLGFKPKHVSVFSNTTYKVAYVYDENVSTTNYSGGQGAAAVNFAAMSSNNYCGQFHSIDDDGFTLIRYVEGYTDNDIYWVATE